MRQWVNMKYRSISRMLEMLQTIVSIMIIGRIALTGSDMILLNKKIVYYITRAES